jgi:CheY-like chemotaxis protein
MLRQTQAIPRHLIFVLEDGDIVVQRGANVVELLATHEHRVYDDFDRDHAVTDGELQALMEQKIITAFDEMTVWLPKPEPSRELSYYFLDTKLPPITLKMVKLLLHTAGLKYVAKTRMGRVSIMGGVGDPFSRLPDAEMAFTLVKQALGDHLINLSIEKITINPRADETQVADVVQFEDLIRETPMTTLADRHLLIVEPEDSLAEELQVVLQTLGVHVQTASHGEQALEIMLDEEPDLLIVDLALPDMHGYELIAKVRRDPIMASTPILAISHLDTEIDAVFALNVAKVEDYLVRPVGVNVLRQRVLTLLNQMR